jgi:steroid 5-alpha reductase family enzyme
MAKSASLAVLLLASAHAFVVPRGSVVRGQSSATARPAERTHRTELKTLRGGTAPQATLAGALSGVSAIPVASGIACVAGSLAYIRQAYIFSLSYGLSMLGIGAAVLSAAPTSAVLVAHASLVAAYGARLFAFLLWRQKLQPGYDGEARLRALDKTPRLQRTPIILSTSLFYGLMASPLLFHLQAAPLAGAAAAVSAAGCAVAAFGLLFEAVADQQKSLFKMACRAAGKDDELYTGGLYARSRHANYFGEIVFWAGSFVAGLPALFAAGLPLVSRALRLVASGLGLYGIVFIMLSATKRLEGRQAAKHRPSAAFDKWFTASNALMPRLL